MAQPLIRNHEFIALEDEVWTAIFYLAYPKEEELPISVESWPYARYIIYKSYDGKYGENLMGYVQFNTKVLGSYLRSLHPKIIWKKQSRSNFRCIEYIKTYQPDKIIKPLVEMGEHFPFRPLPTIPSEVISEGDEMKEDSDEKIRIAI